MGAVPKREDLNSLRELFKPHIESFDYFIESGLEDMLLHIKPAQLIHPQSGTKLRLWFENPELYSPFKGDENRKAIREPLLPMECRQAGLSYHGRFYADVCFQWSGGPVIREKFSFGFIPIMLMSKLCHLRGADPQKLISFKEEAAEMGGYFICNGMERLFRLLIMPKRNYPMALVRPRFRERGDGYSNKAVLIRCVRQDQSSVTIRLYYLQNGSARLGFSIKRREYLLPVGIILKALIDTNDYEIYTSLACCYSETHKKGKGVVGSQLVGERAKIILDEVRALSLLTHLQCKQHIGECYRPVMNELETESDAAVGEAVLREYVFVHLGNNHDKFNLLIFMLQKLFALVDQTAMPDNSDALQNQEVLQPGHVITIYLKERLQEWLYKSRWQILTEIKKKGEQFDFCNLAQVKKVMEKISPSTIGKAIENLIRSGKLLTSTGLDLQQTQAMTIQAERLNYLRFLSHFRSVHRGSFFVGNRDTTVRKLLPESWGFLCPVHTPDGTPCGLLNHMTCTCRITSFFDSIGNTKDFQKIRMSIVNVLVGMGMTPLLPRIERTGAPEVLYVLLDGIVVGSIASSQIETAVSHIRRLKISSSSGIPNDLEVGYIPLTIGGAYPGLYLFTSPSRFVRPVRNITHTLENAGVELIGPFEQAYMEIKCADGGNGGMTSLFPATHEEIHPTGILSVVANLTPWSDHNQSPRNMYQCQMAKQTMGFSSQAIQFRADNKLYHLQTPQSPIVRTTAYSKFQMNEYPTGTNAIVAVLAYSGYDMEDAMILNKSSVERGMCHGHIYQTQTIDLVDQRKKSDQGFKVFDRSKIDRSMATVIDADGLPYVGQTVNPGDPYYSVHDTVTNSVKSTMLKGTEPAIVDYVSVDGTACKDYVQKVNIRLRYRRNPVIGDKFSSRHGQKGVCSQLWPDIDMPFSAVTGMRPDLIINPHAFPSRMTIGMLLESIAAKGGSLHGEFIDATPFANSVREDGKSATDSDSLVDTLGPMLTKYGFNYHGLEVMYSGVLGTELACEIFIGPVYYQRLRHMVSDKFQVRSTGTVDPVTRQPIHGRKAGGGIRFGEMERDSIIAHGAAYLLHDRLHTCSDYHVADVCSLCGSILTASFVQPQKRTAREIGGLPPGRAPKKVTCHACKTSKGMETVAMPFVFRQLAAELAAMNVKMTLQLSNQAGI